MSVFNEIKDIIKFVQKTDNLEMVNTLIDIQSKIIDMQDELMNLREENDKLKKNQEIEEKIMRFPNDTVITLKGEEGIKYCSKCWDDERKLIQVKTDENHYSCPKCGNGSFFYNTRRKKMVDEDFLV